jgi:hypothetical protein
MLMSKAAQTLDSFITNTLNIDVKPIFDETENAKSPSYGYYTAWTSFRVLATAILVIGGLIMVASQALGFEFLDAYTIRKTLPRLFVAVIGISLSWPLMRYVVTFFDTLGFDVRALIYHPFHNFSTSISVGGGILSTLAAGAAILILGPASLTILVTILISVFIGFLALVIREIAIIMLIIVAPLAIACYILPNTQRVWKLWHENFLGLLMAFPLISAVIAAGKVFAAVSLATSTNAGGVITRHAIGAVGRIDGGHVFIQHIAAAAANNIGGLTAQAVALFAAYAPYLLIGTIIQRTTGAISTFAGGAGGFLQGVSKKMSAVRGNAAAKNTHAMATGNRFKGDSKAARLFNKTTEGVAGVSNAGWNPARMGSRMQAAKSQRVMAEAAEYGEKNGAFSVIKGNDDYLMAGIKSKGNDNKVREYLLSKGYDSTSAEQGVAAVRAARRDTNSEVFDVAALKALPATGTAFKTEVDENGRLTGRGGAGEMMAMINEVAGNDSVMGNRLLAEMRGAANGARRFEIAGGSFREQSELMGQMKDGTPGVTAESVTKKIVRSSIRGQGAGYLAQIKGSAAPAVAAGKLEEIESAVSSGDDARVSREMASLAALHSRIADAPIENQEAYAKLMGTRMVVKDLHKDEQGQQRLVTDSLRGHMTSREDDEYYQQVKKEMTPVQTNRVATDEDRGYAQRGRRGGNPDAERDAREAAERDSGMGGLPPTP